MHRTASRIVAAVCALGTTAAAHTAYACGACLHPTTQMESEATQVVGHRMLFSVSQQPNDAVGPGRVRGCARVVRVGPAGACARRGGALVGRVVPAHRAAHARHRRVSEPPSRRFVLGHHGDERRHQHHELDWERRRRHGHRTGNGGPVRDGPAVFGGRTSPLRLARFTQLCHSGRPRARHPRLRGRGDGLPRDEAGSGPRRSGHAARPGVTSPGAGLTLPLRMVAGGAGAYVPIHLWAFGEGRYGPQSHPWFVVDPEARLGLGRSPEQLPAARRGRP